MEDPPFNLGLDTITPQGSVKGAHKADITLDENMVTYEEIENHIQRSYKTTLNWKHRAKPRREQSVDGKSHTGLVTIPEEVETNM